MLLHFFSLVLILIDGNLPLNKPIMQSTERSPACADLSLISLPPENKIKNHDEKNDYQTYDRNQPQDLIHILPP